MPLASMCNRLLNPISKVSPGVSTVSEGYGVSRAVMLKYPHIFFLEDNVLIFSSSINGKTNCTVLEPQNPSCQLKPFRRVWMLLCSQSLIQTSEMSTRSVT